MTVPNITSKTHFFFKTPKVNPKLEFYTKLKSSMDNTAKVKSYYKEVVDVEIE